MAHAIYLVVEFGLLFSLVVARRLQGTWALWFVAHGLQLRLTELSSCGTRV